MSCYFGAEACRHGHVVDCPARDGDPWEERTKPNAAAPGPVMFTEDGRLEAIPVEPGSKWYFSSAEKRWILDDE